MNYAIILASGTGSRMGTDVPKQFVEINGKTILEYTISAFEQNEMTDRIILVTSLSYLDFCKKLNFKKLYKVVEGGKRRQDSSYNGVKNVPEDNAKILIHDGARPFIDDETINACYNALDSYKAVNTGVETTDTIMRVDENGIIKEIPKRSTLLRCQTPQGFRADLIKKAHEFAYENNIEVTDDAGLILASKLEDVFVVKGKEGNIKITYKNDLEYAEKNLF